MAEAIRFKNVSKRFILHHDKARSFQDMVVNMFRHNGSSEEFWALRDVSFAVPAGESLGIIGQNGSGKSTVLKLVSRILRPTSGSVGVNGRVSALLELGAGFHPDLTGKENVYLNGSILGLSKREIDARFEEMVEFSELERFIDTPIKHFSSGMYMRLGFAVAVMATPDILVIDEVLAVGDDAFREKCLQKINRLRDAGTTILFVSHAAPVVQEVCDRVILLHDGELVAQGHPRDVLRYYEELLAAHSGHGLRQSGGPPKAHRHQPDGADTSEQADDAPVDASSVHPLPPEGEPPVVEAPAPPAPAPPAADSGVPPAATPAPAGRSSGATGEVRITGVELLDDTGVARSTFKCGENMVLQLHFERDEIVETPNFAVYIANGDGLRCHCTGARGQGLDLSGLPSYGILRVEYERLPLGPGSYYFIVDVTRGRPDLPLYDRRDGVARFEVKGDRRGGRGIVSIANDWRLLVDSRSLGVGERT